MEEVVSDGAVLVELDPGSIGLRMTLMPFMKGCFGGPLAQAVAVTSAEATTTKRKGAVKLTFDLRRETRAGFEVWAGKDVGRNWAKFVKWLDESGVRRTEEIGDGGVVIRVSQEDDRAWLEEALGKLGEEERRKYRVVLEKVG